MHFLTLKDLGTEGILHILKQADYIKKNPHEFSEALQHKTLLMIFQKPSLRTRVSFEVGMTQMGGHGIFYDVSTSPLGKKETMADTAKTASRYCDLIMARLFDHADIEELAKHAKVPVINALTNFSHPCQILADLQTIQEKKGTLKGLKLVYLGDSNNNVTHSLLYGCSMVGMHIAVASPPGKKFEPQAQVVQEAQQFARPHGSTVLVTNDVDAALQDADIVVTDSWMSYHIPDSEKDERMASFKPYQVTAELMQKAKPDALFMHCLPAMRDYEVTADVIDGPQSVVFDEAENRLYAQKALMVELFKRKS